MWGEFAAACIACFVMLFAPGYFIMRTFSARRTIALAASPCFSVAIFALEAIVYLPLGINCSAVSIFVPPLVVAVCAYVIRAAISRSIPGSNNPNRTFNRDEAIVLALYFAVGLAAVIYFYLMTLDSPQSFSQEFDNLFHLSLVQRFLESGQWSSLVASIYADPLNPAYNPTPNQAMYPSAWHAVCALVGVVFGQTAPFAINVTNTVFMSFVFPGGMYLLITTIFPQNRRVQYAGAFATMAFSSFPWRLLWWGPIYPNLSANCLLPAVLTLCIFVVQRGENRSSRILFAVSVLFGGVSLALLQPSAVFALVVFLTPYCSWRIYAEALRKWPHSAQATWVRRLFSIPVLLGALFALVVVIAWVSIYFLLSESPVLSFTWAWLMPIHEGILNVLFLNYCYCPWAPALAFLVVVGIIYSLWRGKSRWVVASYVLMCAMLVITLSVDNDLKHVVGGFWYTDQMRLAALAAIFAVPLAALGAHATLKFISFACMQLPLSLDRCMIADLAIRAAVVVLLLVSTYFPYDLGKSANGQSHETAMGNIRNTIKWTYNKHPLWYYTNEEEQFVKRVLEQYPDEQFINNPFDGSCWAYGANGLNVFYRAFDVYGYSLESEQSKAIRLRLNCAAHDETVREALRAMDARYVIQLDAYGKTYDAMYQWMYHLMQWDGFNSVNEETPGFELVMSQGDMRLYRITCLDY